MDEADTVSEQPEALRIAEWLDGDYYSDVRVTAAAAELRRLHAECDELRTELATLRAQNYETQSLLNAAEAAIDAAMTKEAK